MGRVADLALLRVVEGKVEGEVFTLPNKSSVWCISTDPDLDQEVEDSLGAKRLVRVKVETVGVWRRGRRVV